MIAQRRRGVIASRRRISPPAGVAGLVRWWKADALALNDNDAVGTWPDSSGFIRNLTQATAGSKPTYKTNILNGLPVVRFDGTDDVLTSASGTGPKHVFAVAKYNTATFVDYDGLVTGAGAGDAEVVLTGRDGQNFFFNSPAVTTDYYKNGTSFVETAMTGPMNAFAVMSISSAGFQNPMAVQVGLDRNNAGRYWNGDVAEILAYNAVLSAGDRQAIQNYLGTKYGITIA